jgi:hypothetical protein
MRSKACILLVAAGIAAGQSAVPIPKVTGPIPVTKDSYPLTAADRVQTKSDLSPNGYVEEEFFVSGAANVYNWAQDGTLSVKTPSAPYTTRILVRRPAEAAKFSGNVIVENLENTRSYDWAFLWAHSGEFFMSRGDAWVGMTHLPTAVAAAKKFNPARYAPLSFANPNPAETCEARNVTSDSEDGLQYDIFSQVGALLKSSAPNKPLAGFRVEYLYGTSHTGELLTYATAIQSRAGLDNGKPVYDGFLSKTDTDPVRISRCAPPMAKTDPRFITRNAGVPFLRFVPEGDVPSVYKYVRRPDSDEPNDRYRLYEVAGASHMDAYFYHNMPLTEDQVKAGQPAFLALWPLAYACQPETAPPDWPALKLAVTAGFQNLDLWVRKGVAPPQAERIQIKEGDKPAVVADRNGNAAGGVRTPQVDVPVATYVPNSDGPAICHNVGHSIPFDWVKLQALYGSPKGYAAKVAADVDKLVKERWLTEFDGKRLKAEAAASPIPARSGP